MIRLLQFMASNTERRPGRSLVVIGALTLILAFFAAQQTTDTTVTAFAPGSERAALFDRVQDEFAAGGSRVQVIVDAGDGGNVFAPSVVDLANRIAADVQTGPAVAPRLAPPHHRWFAPGAVIRRGRHPARAR